MRVDLFESAKLLVKRFGIHHFQVEAAIEPATGKDAGDACQIVDRLISLDKLPQLRGSSGAGRQQ